MLYKVLILLETFWQNHPLPSLLTFSPLSPCSDKLSLRKIKSGAVKPFFMTFMHQAPGQDVRLKLTGQNQFAKVSLSNCGHMLAQNGLQNS